MSKASASCFKSPLQSHVGEDFRRSKLGIMRVFLNSIGLPTLKVLGGPKIHIVKLPHSIRIVCESLHHSMIIIINFMFSNGGC